MDLVFGPGGNFDEVYLYVRPSSFTRWNLAEIALQEELMEADLHAIVRESHPSVCFILIRFPDPIPTTSIGCPLPVFYLSDIVWPEVHSLRQCYPSRSEARQLACQCRLRAEDLRFRSCSRLPAWRRQQRQTWF